MSPARICEALGLAVTSRQQAAASKSSYSPQAWRLSPLGVASASKAGDRALHLNGHDITADNYLPGLRLGCQKSSREAATLRPPVRAWT
jgi:hypothetical protein